MQILDMITLAKMRLKVVFLSSGKNAYDIVQYVNTPFSAHSKIHKLALCYKSNSIADNIQYRNCFISHLGTLGCYK